MQCCGFPLRTNVDDVGFVAALLDHLGRFVNVDPGRVYAAGRSNGGMFAHRVGAELSDRQISVPDQPVSVLQFHGRNDQKVRWGGGKSADADRVDLSFEETSRFWGSADGCEPEPTTVPLEYGFTWAYSDCSDGVEVESITISDHPHGYPTIENIGVDGPGDAIEFFLSHGR